MYHVKPLMSTGLLHCRSRGHLTNQTEGEFNGFGPATRIPHKCLSLLPRGMLLWCFMMCLVAQSCPTLWDPMDCSLPGSSVHGDSPGKNTGVGCHVLLQGVFLPNPGIKPRSSKLQVVSLPSEPPGKPMNTGLSSLSLLQGMFQTQESNWDLLHCRWILYKLGYQESPWCFINNLNELGVGKWFLVSR